MSFVARSSPACADAPHTIGRRRSVPVGPLLLAPLFMRALGILRGDHSMGRRTQTVFVLAVALAGCAGAFTADPMDGDAGRSSAEEAGADGAARPPDARVELDASAGVDAASTHDAKGNATAPARPEDCRYGHSEKHSCSNGLCTCDLGGTQPNGARVVMGQRCTSDPACFLECFVCNPP